MIPVFNSSVIIKANVIDIPFMVTLIRALLGGAAKQSAHSAQASRSDAVLKFLSCAMLR